MVKKIVKILAISISIVIIVGLTVGLLTGLLLRKKDNTKKLYIENWEFFPHTSIYLVGVKDTPYSFSKSLSQIKYDASIKQLKLQKPEIKDFYLPTTVLNGKILVVKSMEEFNDEVFADVIIASYDTIGCQTFGKVSSDAMQIAISDGKFISTGVISHSNCKIAPQIVAAIKDNFTNGRLDECKVYLGPSSRSPYYYVGDNIYNQFTGEEQRKYFKVIYPGDKDFNGTVIIHKKDELDGKPRYGFDYSVYFKDQLVEEGIPRENIRHDERNLIFSENFASVRAETARTFNENPMSNRSLLEINEAVGRNLMLVSCK
jgi:hypothetical protein